MFVVQCEELSPWCFHTGYAALGFDEKMALVMKTLSYYRSMTGNWRKHVACWLKGICQRMIQGTE
jgi:hypothetical protein